MSAADIHRHVTEVYGTEAMSESKVRKWAVESVWQARLCLMYLFQYLMYSLGGKRFTDNEVKVAVNFWLSDKVEDFFDEGFQNFVLSSPHLHHCVDSISLKKSAAAHTQEKSAYPCYRESLIL
ncbi:hypothetical protein TNCV_4716931 [Trichonephila clavipes]|nr:hypothetical protein TNCV_4716931 [Trichonephila clavipes]